MKECWINVYIYNILGYCWPNKQQAMAQYEVGIKPIYRIHVKMK